MLDAIYVATIFVCGLFALYYPVAFGDVWEGALGAAVGLVYLPYLSITRLIKLGNLKRGLDFWEKALLFAWVFTAYAGFVGMSAAQYRFFGLKDGGSQAPVYDATISLYFSIITLTTVGYGDFVPLDNYGRLAAAWEALSGYLMMAVLVAVLVPLFGKRSPTA